MRSQGCGKGSASVETSACRANWARYGVALSDSPRRWCNRAISSMPPIHASRTMLCSPESLARSGSFARSDKLQTVRGQSGCHLTGRLPTVSDAVFAPPHTRKLATTLGRCWKWAPDNASFSHSAQSKTQSRLVSSQPTAATAWRRQKTPCWGSDCRRGWPGCRTYQRAGV